MAEECISALFPEGYWTYCWESTVAEPNWDASNVDTGLRKGQGADARAWRTCQYYLKGLPSICSHWEGARCGYGSADGDTPTGYNDAWCDNLGRRSWCDKYSGDTTATDEWTCAAPNGYITGLGKRAAGEEAPIIRLLDRSEITGFNEGGGGAGKCDCYGMGRGAAGCSKAQNSDPAVAEDQLLALPVACNFYRPWSMGFGAIQPRGYDPGQPIDEAIAATDVPMQYRLPLSVELINARARFQRCQFWDEDYGSQFVLSGDKIILKGADIGSNGRVEQCTQEDDLAQPYNSRIISGPVPYLTREVSAQGGGLICNGCRPECPRYTNKWVHCTHSKMSAGMPVTANQILELRFWTAEWESKAQYDKFFQLKQNFVDGWTSDLYTFTRWSTEEGEVTHDTSRMWGKKLNLCFPIPLEEKEFTEESIKVEEPIKYAPPYTETGTVSSDQVHFPTLVRVPEFEDVRLLSVAYPPYSDTGKSGDCDDDGSTGYADLEGHWKYHHRMDGDWITMVGTSVRGKNVFVINSYKLDVDAMIKEYDAMFNVAIDLRNYITNKLIKNVVEAQASTDSDWMATTISDPIFGYFVTAPIRLQYGTVNEFLMAVDYGDGHWEFRWRKVYSRWCGGIIVQNSYEHEHEKGDENDMPLSITPPATIDFDMIPLGSSVISKMVLAYSFEPATMSIPYRYYNYFVVTTGGTVEDAEWHALGSTPAIGVSIYDDDLNYIYDWDIDTCTLSPNEEMIQKLKSLQLPITPVEFRQYLYDPTDPESKIDRESIPPNFRLMVPIDSNERRTFYPSEWDIGVTYHKDIWVNEDPSSWFFGLTEEESATIKSGAGSSELNKYGEPDYWVYGHTQIRDVSKGPVQVMANFYIGSRLVSTMATKAVIPMVMENCRPVDIYYRYEAPGKHYKLMPEKGFCVEPAGEQATGIIKKHVEAPNCGDHEHAIQKWEGPMWFPFNTCRGFDMYDEFTVCNSCQAGYVGDPLDNVNGSTGAGTVITRADYRYCGPHKYRAYGDTRGNFAQACDCGCSFYFSDASGGQPVFSGYGRIRGPVNLDDYDLYGYMYPPYGNEGREVIQRYVCQDYISHFKLSGMETRDEWMPIVMDNGSFFLSFNAWDNTQTEESLYIQAHNLDDFYYVSQMSLFLNSTVGESLEVIAPIIDENTGEVLNPESAGGAKRYDFDDLFTVHHEGNSSHPSPILFGAFGFTTVIFYFFKEEVAQQEEGLTWAWQEYWKATERGLESDSEEMTDIISIHSPETSDEDIEDIVKGILDNLGSLDFVESYGRPNYIFSIYKEEHRLICDEGKHIVKFEAPTLDELGNLLTDAVISIDDGPSRTFQVLYGSSHATGNYNETSVTWLDKGGDSQSLASSNEDNFYEKANGGEWLHSEDMLFTGDASKTTSEAADDDKSVVVGVTDFGATEVIKYFNRGVEINIPRSRLDFMPKEFTEYNYVGHGIFQEPGDEGGSISTLSTPVWSQPSGEDERQYNPPGNYSWKTGTASFVYTGGTFTTTKLYSVKIVGLWGRDGFMKVVKPAVSVVGTYRDGTSTTPRYFNSPPTVAEYHVANALSPEGIQNDTSQMDTYVISWVFRLGPWEMIGNPMQSFALILTNGDKEDDFISVNSMTLTVADRYEDGKTELIKTWQRKYRTSKCKVGDFNLDAEDNIGYQRDGNNSGQYFPLKKAHDDISRPDVEISAQNKTKAIYAGKFYEDDTALVITIGNLKEIELNEQKKWYEFAIEKDEAAGKYEWESTPPSKLEGFMSLYKISWPSYNLTFEAPTLAWEDHKLTSQFEQYEFWRPGGHKYKWDGNFRREKCMLFGGAEDVHEAIFEHVDHTGEGNPIAGATQPVDPANSYYSLRFHVQKAKYNRAMILAGGDPDFDDTILSVGGADVTTFVGR